MRNAGLSVVTLALCALLPNSAQAQADVSEPKVYPWGTATPALKWQGTESDYWIMEKDISWQAGQVTAWVIGQYKVATGEGVVKTLTRMTFDCAGRYAITAQSSFGANDKLLRENDYPFNWQYVRPYSATSSIGEGLCSAGKPWERWSTSP